MTACISSFGKVVVDGVGLTGLRISIGLPQENALLIAALGKVLAEVKVVI
jgi:histidinol-phosphate/aromatic aminotransferase/cobyric acid decarboxylase-like protein